MDIEQLYDDPDFAGLELTTYHVTGDERQPADVHLVMRKNHSRMVLLSATQLAKYNPEHYSVRPLFYRD